MESIKNFVDKIKVGKKLTKSLMIISRIESLILGKGIKDALKRADEYLSAGAKAIMIHSKKDNPKEIFNFAKQFRKNIKRAPLVVVPSTFSQVKEETFIEHGFSIFKGHIKLGNIGARHLKHRIGK